MTILASEAASIAEGSAAQSAATTIGKSAKKRQSRPAASARKQMSRQHLSRVAPKSQPAGRRATSSKSVSVGKSHYKSYKGSGGRSDTSLKLKGPKALTAGGSGKTSTLIVEWAIGALIIFWALMDGTKKTKSFQSQAHSFFWRFFGWTFVFFVLALLMRGKNTGKFAVLFGALLDVTMIISAIINGSLGTLENLFSGAGSAAPGGSPGTPGAQAPGGNPPSSNPSNPLNPNAPQSQPQSPSNPQGIPSPLGDPLGFLKHLVTNPPGILKLFDPFTLFHGLFWWGIMKEGMWALLSGLIVLAILFVLVVKRDQNGNSPVVSAIATVGQSLADAISLAVNGPKSS
jgi:hypothetical protein